MIEQSYKCDVCGAMRGPANHWMLAERFGSQLNFYEWDDGITSFSYVWHLCSAKCAHSFLDKWIEEAQKKSHGGAA